MAKGKRMVPIDAELVRRLIAAQYTDGAGLPITPVLPGGWDNRTFRLGDGMLVRLPSAARYVAQVEKEHRWLPRLASQLPLPIPSPIHRGLPDAGFPWPWSIYRWIAGESADRRPPLDEHRFARDLARFLLALRAIDASDGPLAGVHNFHRGGSLAVYDGETRAAIAALADAIDAAAVTEVWDRALASSWRDRPVWVHGDVAEGNLLVRDGRLCAVIDFGSSGVGDPASDLFIAWSLFDASSRATFREAIGLDDQTWERGRGWRLWKALIQMVQHHDSDAAEFEKARAILREVLADHAASRS